MAATDVIVTANVVGWTFDDAGNIVGAQLRVGVQAPEGTTDFRAVVHATFQGYGVLTEPQPDMEM